MLGWAIAFLISALVAGALGFGGVAAVSVEAAQVVFWVFLVLFVVSLLYGLITGRRPPAVRSHSRWIARDHGSDAQSR